MTCSGIVVSSLQHRTELFRNVPNTAAQNVLPERSERAVVGVPASLGVNDVRGRSMKACTYHIPLAYKLM